MKQDLHPKKGTKRDQRTKWSNLLPLVFATIIPLTFPSLHAQETLNATGGSATISGDVYAYSIGEMVLVNTVTTSNLIVTQGLLQSNVHQLEIEEVDLLTAGLVIYPNPVDNILFMQPSFPGEGELSLQLFDLHGRLILRKDKLLDFGIEKQRFDLSMLQGGTYLLVAELEQNERSYKHTYKIVKQ